MCQVTVTGLPDGEDMPQEEINAYIDRERQKHGVMPESIDIHVDGEYVDIKTVLPRFKPFMRIRRITGYLVGSLDNFNNGKRAEEHDRVKHSV